MVFFLITSVVILICALLLFQGFFGYFNITGFIPGIIGLLVLIGAGYIIYDIGYWLSVILFWTLLIVFIIAIKRR